MSLDLSFRVAARDVDLALRVETGETIAILGPNGAGKSTLVEVLAGLLRPDAGRAVLDDPVHGRLVLFDFGGTGTATWLPPHRRGVSLLAQEALLFPHLSVLENVAFGLRSTGGSRGVARERAAHWLAAVDASAFAERSPAELSGGQAQRIAVARALAPDPRILLLDEPMAALDVTVAPALRRMLREVLADRTTILITHDVLDAYTLADRVVVIGGGRVIEEGPTRAVLERPRSAFTAELTGRVLVTGTATTRGIALESRARDSTASNSTASNSTAGDSTEILVAEGAPLPPAGTAAACSFPPSAVRVLLADEDRAVPPGTVRAIVTDIEPRGETVRVRAADIAADVHPMVVADLDLRPGLALDFVVDPAGTLVYEL